MKAAKSINKFKMAERVKFLREIAGDLRRDDLQQATVIVLRRDGSLGWTDLNPRGTISEVIGMLERTKLEMFADLREKRRDQS